MGKPMIITDEEHDLVRSAVMLPIILDVLEYDNEKIKNSDLKLPIVYIANNKNLQEYITRDITIVKKELRNRGIKIYEQGKTPTGYQAKYVCRGYQHEKSWLSNYIRSIVIVRLTEMMGFPIDLIRDLK